jgi:glutathione S-transferase
MIKLYKANRSGNCYKVELFLGMNAIPYEIEIVDVLNRRNQTAAFEAISAFQQVPALADGDDVIWDSQAILVHLACRYARRWMPPPATVAHSHMHEWLSVAANEIANSLQPMRLLYLIGLDEAAHHMNVAIDKFDIPGCERRCERVLSRMDRRLNTSPWLAGPEATLADIACYPYTSLAYQGRIEMARYPAVGRWLARFAALPGMRPIDTVA